MTKEKIVEKILELSRKNKKMQGMTTKSIMQTATNTANGFGKIHSEEEKQFFILNLKLVEVLLAEKKVEK